MAHAAKRANLNILCTGIWLAWPSPVLVKLRDPDEDVLGRPITELEGSWIVSIGLLVGIFGREAEAIKLLTYLRGSEAAANAEIKEYAMSKSEVTQVNRLDLFKNRTFLKTLGIGSTLNIGAAMVGMNAVSFYLQTILESTGTSVRPEIASVIIGIIQLVASICSTVITDLSGRKPILIVTLIGLALGMAGLGAFFWIADSTDEITGFMNFLPLISIIFVVFSFSAGLGSVNWALIAELFDGSSKALGMPIITTVLVTFNFLLAKFFQPVTVAIGAAPTYWLFMTNCIIMAVFIITCVPETKGKTFAQIQAELGGKPVPSDEESVEPKVK